MKLAISLAALVVISTSSALAGAQEEPVRRAIPAPRRALEITAGTGYTQGFGSLASGVGLPSVITPGVGFELGLGYRINPKFGVLWSGQYQSLDSERATRADGVTTTISGQYHFRPAERLDPWAELGAGYRFLIEDPGGTRATEVTHGFQLARLRVGLDYRIDEHVAIGPVVGAEASVFLFQDIPNAPSTISDPRLSTFVFAGVQGRFDVLGTRETTATTVSSR